MQILAHSSHLKMSNFAKRGQQQILKYKDTYYLEILLFYGLPQNHTKGTEKQIFRVGWHLLVSSQVLHLLGDSISGEVFALPLPYSSMFIPSISWIRHLFMRCHLRGKLKLEPFFEKFKIQLTRSESFRGNYVGHFIYSNTN